MGMRALFLISIHIAKPGLPAGEAWFDIGCDLTEEEIEIVEE